MIWTYWVSDQETIDAATPLILSRCKVETLDRSNPCVDIGVRSAIIERDIAYDAEMKAMLEVGLGVAGVFVLFLLAVLAYRKWDRIITTRDKIQIAMGAEREIRRQQQEQFQRQKQERAKEIQAKIMERVEQIKNDSGAL